MTTQHGDLALLNEPLARELLAAPVPARLAYTWTDGTPRVVPLWFHWDGAAIVMAGPVDAPKVAALRARPAVALTIDDAGGWPYKALLLRGTATIDEVAGIPPEYAAAAGRYLGPAHGQAWVGTMGALLGAMARITVRPTWAGLLDFEARFPQAFARRMGPA